MIENRYTSCNNAYGKKTGFEKDERGIEQPLSYVDLFYLEDEEFKDTLAAKIRPKKLHTKKINRIKNRRCKMMDKYLELLLENNHSEIKRYFIDHEIDDEIAGETPLIWAVRQNNMEFVKRLIEIGADPNKMDGMGRSPLEIACFFGYLEIAKYL